MSDTVLGWLFGGWSFGQSDEGKAGSERARPRNRALDDHEVGKANQETSARATDQETGQETDQVTDDTHLVAQIRAGDAAALKALFLRYYAPLVDFASSYVESMDDGEEVVADVLAWLWAHRATWTPTVGVSAYLYGAVRNRALNAVRRRAQHHQQTVAMSALGEIPGSAPASLGPVEQVERDDYNRVLRSLIAKLPERRKLILSLRWTHELAWDEIASVLGGTSTAVRREHSRIVAALRAELQGK